MPRPRLPACLISALLLMSAATAKAETPQRSAYFGDLHLHTALSLDSYIFGNRNDPETAYRFAQGQPVTLANGQVRQLKVPLDFVAVTDHAEYMGEIELCTQAGRPEYDSPICQGVRRGDMAEIYRISATVSSAERKHIKELCGDDGSRCDAGSKRVWERVRQAAAQAYRPGRFTTLIGFEYSPGVPAAGPQRSPVPGMMHRNVLFRSEQVPDRVFSAYDGSGEDLHRWLEGACTAPCRVLTIPHNSNYSWGRFFTEGKNSDNSAWTREILERRARLEPLVEVFQIKGGSECAAGIGLTDEECGFENAAPVCPPGESTECADATSFVRDALVTGLRVQRQHGVNPFKYGLIGSTDSHNGNPGDTSELSFPGAHAQSDGTPERRLRLTAANKDDGHGHTADPSPYNPGGLAGVWADANTREGIWDALARRETFGTSGTRIRVRFFGGYGFPRDLHTRADLVAVGYEKGVPMGGDLAPAAGNAAPSFVLWATRDPDSAPLQKIQVVKGWIDADGTSRSRTMDVACSGGRAPDAATGLCPDNGATVDSMTCEPRGEGAAELATTWSDPAFDPRQRAVYYARVLENPVCRWSTREALRMNAALPGTAARYIKERAWSSPIWYTPREN